MYTDPKKMADRFAQNMSAPLCPVCKTCRPVAAYGGWLCAKELAAVRKEG